MRKVFKIKGIDCANCAAELERAIEKIENIQSVSISFITERMVLEYNEENEKEVMKNLKKVIKREEPDATLEEF